MPEFEESDSQPNPEYNYTPSTSASKNKGGRRRSGGFKSEATPSNQKIGEVDPTEVLKTDVKSDSQASGAMPDNKACCSSKGSKPSCHSSRTPKPKEGSAQPSQATLDSIKKVEERIAKRRAEAGANRSEKSPRGSGATRSRKHDDNKKNTTGLLGKISRFLGSLFGSSPESPPKKSKERPTYKKQYSGKNKSSGGNGHRRNDSGKKHQNSRGGGQRRQKNASLSS